ncbi:hypothetical protein D9758_005951 [Tetrapyrgos nigripes]|uniref:N-acetyltransferase domain-containing protein n=1 Tax=Tetrapyrgos nigripes TaxID=182062 RepID=A0A8H5G374_9AGAR|nr:hypothetical protein D9758_005951 [Tetrapyrgos nigripes]
MPSRKLEFTAAAYYKASSLPAEVFAAFEQNPVTFNCMLPHILKCLKLEEHGRVIDGQCWIVVTTYNPEPRVDFVLSCTENEMGKYPIFIASTSPPPSLSDEFVRPRLHLIVEHLLDIVDLYRVYSVFAPDAVAYWFAQLWTEQTGIRCYDNPYYAAKLSVCCSKTFKYRSVTISPGLEYNLRPAVEADLHAVAELCYGFAQESEPFVLDAQGAVREASILIQNATVWIHEVRWPNKAPMVASLVAFTRNSATVSTITKVYTNPGARGMGCAQRLVRRVCKHLFSTERKEKVALYVAHNNLAASKVYHRVGFTGLDPENSTPSPEVESWTEIGFDRAKVELGHW